MLLTSVADNPGNCALAGPRSRARARPSSRRMLDAIFDARNTLSTGMPRILAGNVIATSRAHRLVGALGTPVRPRRARFVNVESSCR